jgi:hypothetical protein
MKVHSKSRALKQFEQIPPAAFVHHDDPRLLVADAVQLDPQTRHRMIAEAAYQRAAQRGFQGGSALADWLAAEAEIDAQQTQ